MFQKKVMNGFRETASRTNGGDSLGLKRLLRETKDVFNEGKFGQNRPFLWKMAKMGHFGDKIAS